jgi:hypothetical protein
MYETGQTAGAHPQTLALGPHREQYCVLFTCAALEAGLLDVEQAPRLFTGVGRRFVEGNCFSGLDGECPCGAHAQTKAGAIAQLVADDASLAIYQLNRPFGAGRHTQTTTIA